MTFADTRTQLFALYRSGQYQQALALAEGAAAAYPAEAWDTFYWRICLHAVLGETDRSVALLEEALETGLWYGVGMLTHEGDLTPLHDLPRFQAVVGVCRERQEAAQARAEAARMVLHPEQEREPASLLVALHGYNGNALRFAEHWQGAVDQGWRVLLPQSSQVVAPSRFGWENRSLGIKEVLEHHTAVTAQAPVEAGQTVLSGYSMGGGLAIELALTGTIATAGFIAVGPWVQKVEALRTALGGARPAQVRGYIVVGEQDAHCYQVSKAAAAFMQEHGLPCHLEVIPGLGHAFPPDFGQILDKALRFIANT